MNLKKKNQLIQKNLLGFLPLEKKKVLFMLIFFLLKEERKKSSVLFMRKMLFLLFLYTSFSFACILRIVTQQKELLHSSFFAFIALNKFFFS